MMITSISAYLRRICAEGITELQRLPPVIRLPFVLRKNKVQNLMLQLGNDSRFSGFAQFPQLFPIGTRAYMLNINKQAFFRNATFLVPYSSLRM